jgi:hypothetical protein
VKVCNFSKVPLNTAIRQRRVSDFNKSILWFAAQVKPNRVFQPVVAAVQQLLIFHFRHQPPCLRIYNSRFFAKVIEKAGCEALR